MKGEGSLCKRLVVRCEGPLLRGARIELDGKPLPNVKALWLSASATEPVRLLVEFTNVEADVDMDVAEVDEATSDFDFDRYNGVKD